MEECSFVRGAIGMFATGDFVRELIGDLVGRVVHVFTEVSSDVSEQVVTVQPLGTSSETLQVNRLASELDLRSGSLNQDSEKGWILR